MVQITYDCGMVADILSPRLHTLIIEVTSKCNLRCAYCAKSDPVFDAQPDRNTDMSEAALGDLYRFAKEQGIQHVMLSGVGETAMAEGWHEPLADFLNDRSFRCLLVSNFARVFTEDDLAALCKLGAIQISFDSADRQMVRRLRSKADLRTIIYNIAQLRRKTFELGSGPRLMVNCTICSENIGHLAKLAHLCRALSVEDLFISEMMITANNNPFRTIAQLSSDELDALACDIAEAKRILDGSGVTLKVQAPLQHRLDRSENKPFFSCLQPWVSPMIQTDGKVLACCMTDTTIGNMHDQSLADIMDGPKARAVRQSMLDGSPLLPCSTCSIAKPHSLEGFQQAVATLTQPEPPAPQGDLSAASPHQEAALPSDHT